MAIQPQAVSEKEQKAILCICILAAFADGAQAESERSRIEQIVAGFSGEHPDLTMAYQDVLAGRITLEQLVADVQSDSAKALAYEMAVCVCNADGVLTDAEKGFLAELRKRLQLDNASAEAHQQGAEALVTQPLASGPPPPIMDSGREAEIDHQILNASILNGALEIMPHSLATMAIVPLQMRLVYQIGKRYGYELDRGHIRDFLATVGVGLTSQVFEGFTRRLVGGLARGLAGGLIGGLVGQATGSAFAFASTYALGQVARRYYASGRTLTRDQLKEVFSTMLDEARGMQGRYSGDITQRARQVNVADLASLVNQ